MARPTDETAKLFVLLRVCLKKDVTFSHGVTFRAFRVHVRLPPCPYVNRYKRARARARDSKFMSRRQNRVECLYLNEKEAKGSQYSGDTGG